MAAYLVSRGYVYHSLSDVVRQETARQGLEPTRENLVRTGNDLRRSGGPSALVDLLLPGLAWPAVIDSVRNPGEVEALRRLGGFFLLAVMAPARTRYQRLVARARQGDAASLEEFEAFEARENSPAPGEQRITDTVAMADGQIDNAASLAALEGHVDAVLSGS